MIEGTGGCGGCCFFPPCAKKGPTIPRITPPSEVAKSSAGRPAKADKGRKYPPEINDAIATNENVSSTNRLGRSLRTPPPHGCCDGFSTILKNERYFFISPFLHGNLHAPVFLAALRVIASARLGVGSHRFLRTASPRFKSQTFQPFFIDQPTFLNRDTYHLFTAFSSKMVCVPIFKR